MWEVWALTTFGQRGDVGASGLEEHEDDDGSGPRCSGGAGRDTRWSSWSSSAPLPCADQLHVQRNERRGIAVQAVSD